MASHKDVEVREGLWGERVRRRRQKNNSVTFAKWMLVDRWYRYEARIYFVINPNTPVPTTSSTMGYLRWFPILLSFYRHNWGDFNLICISRDSLVLFQEVSE